MGNSSILSVVEIRIYLRNPDNNTTTNILIILVFSNKGYLHVLPFLRPGHHVAKSSPFKDDLGLSVPDNDCEM